MMLQEMERSLHDAICVEQRVMESKSLVVGGGAVETALYLHLKDYAMSLSTSEQLAVEAFGKAMLVIPKTLAVNAAKDATELISQLCARHANAEDPEACFNGLDLVAGAVVNNFKKGVLEPTMNKVKCLKFATEAAITILRIDDMIKINPVVGQIEIVIEIEFEIEMIICRRSLSPEAVPLELCKGSRVIVQQYCGVNIICALFLFVACLSFHSYKCAIHVHISSSI